MYKSFNNFSQLENPDNKPQVDQRTLDRRAVYKGVKDVQKYTRKCLCCGKDFTALGRYNRICSSCKGNQEFKTYG